MIPDGTELRRALADAGADGWLLYDFHGLNPVARRVLGLTGLNTRRLFVLLPADGEPVAVAHRIELQPLEEFPGRIVPYSRWEELHEALAAIVKGRTLAMPPQSRPTSSSRSRRKLRASRIRLTARVPRPGTSRWRTS